jgi:Txe/YoeB family toxin of Txe-Axe toxin-antitoxin module
MKWRMRNAQHRLVHWVLDDRIEILAARFHYGE